MRRRTALSANGLQAAPAPFLGLTTSRGNKGVVSKAVRKQVGQADSQAVRQAGKLVGPASFSPGRLPRAAATFLLIFHFDWLCLRTRIPTDRQELSVLPLVNQPRRGESLPVEERRCRTWLIYVDTVYHPWPTAFAYTRRISRTLDPPPFLFLWVTEGGGGGVQRRKRGPSAAIGDGSCVTAIAYFTRRQRAELRSGPFCV